MPRPRLAVDRSALSDGRAKGWEGKVEEEGVTGGRYSVEGEEDWEDERIGGVFDMGVLL